MTTAKPGDEVFASIQRNRAGEKILVQLTEFKGQHIVDVRIFTPGKAGALLPTAKGISLRPDLIPQIIEALEKTETAAVRAGLLASKAERAAMAPSARAESILARYGE